MQHERAAGLAPLVTAGIFAGWRSQIVRTSVLSGIAFKQVSDSAVSPSREISGAEKRND